MANKKTETTETAETTETVTQPELELTPEQEVEQLWAEKAQQALDGIKKGDRFFIINPAGALHEVNENHYWELEGRRGYREATNEEVKAYFDQKAKQTTKEIPIGERELGTLKRRRKRKA